MMNDNELENRLNAIKNGSNPPESKNLDYEWVDKLSQKEIDSFNLYRELGFVIGIILGPILYGFAFNAIFNQDWTFFEIVGVGFLFHQTMKLLIRGVRKLFLKSTYNN